MRFEYYHPGLENVPKLSVDGIVPNSIHFSHWQGNKTPVSVKADTSTEIALNFVAAPNRGELSEGVDLVTNNHFDTDGVLSVWTVLNAERAEALDKLLISAAEAGDFSAYTGDGAVRASIVIQGCEQPVSSEPVASPFACKLAGHKVEDEGEAYNLVLPQVESVLTRTGAYEDLWREGWLRMEAAFQSFGGGTSTIEEIEDIDLSVILLSPSIFGIHGFNPILHAAPLTAISHYANGKVYLIITPFGGNRWSYRVDYPYFSWAETVVRPHIERTDFALLTARLNELERSQESVWKPDSSELCSAIKFIGPAGIPGASKLRPEVVVYEVSRALREAASSAAVLHRR